MDSTKQNRLNELLAGAVAAAGFEMLGYEFHPRGKNGLLRIYIDHDKGINIDDCEKVSRQITAVLEVEDTLAAEYILEVSSPGLERPLFQLEHFQRFVGHAVRIRLYQTQAGQKNFSGQLVAADMINGITIATADEQQFSFPLAAIAKANLLV